MAFQLAATLLFAIPALAAPAPVSEASPLTKRACAAAAASYATVNVAKLPDPFVFANGDKVATKADWTCRQQEIFAMMTQMELGTKPGKPEKVTGTVSGTGISVTVTDGGKSITFTASIKKPSGGTAPYPAIIGIGGASIPIPAGVATISFGNDDMAAQQNPSSHGTGKFFTLYGRDHPAGALAAWGWGVSRLIDALEATPDAGIDTKRLGVTGCSRNGKGAFVVGALDDRIALTIPQESGSGGAACWRVSDSQKSAGKNIQTAGQIVGENSWFSPKFNTYTSKTSSLPFDHHMLAGLVAPRGLYVVENDIDWLGPVSTTACMKAGRLIYKALGVQDNMGFSLVGGHSHCQFPSSQQAELTAFINKFLLKSGTGDTNIEKSTASVAVADWAPWNVPTLT